MPHYVEPLFRPPSEARSLIFQITVGCSQNHCTFCGMYKMKRFRIRPVEEILEEIAAIPRHYRQHIDRVFLADGDALVYPFAGLVTILESLAATFPGLTRVGAYASPNSLTTKSPAELALLREKSLRILYFGLESGDDATLTAINKGFTADADGRAGAQGPRGGDEAVGDRHPRACRQGAQPGACPADGGLGQPGQSGVFLAADPLSPP